ncbi:MAG: hypothetical protein HY075_01600 [Deltaproteobacteria bacterium]|nr:hypothetical protein [Deltaproteobacteria bacterium]
MMRSSRVLPAALAVATTLVFAGCDGKDMFDSAPGHYEGFVAVKGAGARVEQTLVQADIKKSSKTELAITIAALKGPVTWGFALKARDKDNVELAPTQQPDASARKLKRANNECFAGGQTNAPTSALCFDGHELTIDLIGISGPQNAAGSLTLVLDKYDKTRLPANPEVARPYTLSEIVDRALKQSFTTRVEFEHVVQAKLNAQNQAAMLLPHLSAGTLLSVAWSGISSLLHAVSDLVPFLFPDRWIQAKEASLAAQAERDAFIIMRADAGNIAEGLAYVIERDRMIIARNQTNLASITVIRDEIARRERDNLIQAGSSDDVTSVMNSLEQGLSVMRQLVVEEYTALAQASGFVNPRAISELTSAAGEVSVEVPVELDTASITEVTLQRSYELHQLDTLIDAARWNKYERWFTWMDPAGGAAIGVNLYPYLQVAPSQLRELGTKRENMQALLLQKTENLFGEINQALQAYALAKEGVGIQSRRINRILTNMRLGINFTLADLVGALQSQVAADIAQVNAEYAYYVGISKINRLLFAGPYARLAPDQPQPRPAGIR